MNSIEEEKLFKARFEENKDQIFRLCLGYFQQDKELAEDALQETFIKAWVHRKQFRADANWQTWIYRIAVNTCLFQLKKQKNEQQNQDAFSALPQRNMMLRRNKKFKKCMPASIN